MLGPPQARQVSGGYSQQRSLLKYWQQKKSLDYIQDRFRSHIQASVKQLKSASKERRLLAWPSRSLSPYEKWKSKKDSLFCLWKLSLSVIQNPGKSILQNQYCRRGSSGVRVLYFQIASSHMRKVMTERVGLAHSYPHLLT